MKQKLTLKELARRLKSRKSLKNDKLRNINGGKRKDLKTPAPVRVGPLAPILPQ